MSMMLLEWPDRIEAVKLEDVKAAAAKTLDIRRSVTGILLRPGRIRRRRRAVIRPVEFLPTMIMRP